MRQSWNPPRHQSNQYTGVVIGDPDPREPLVPAAVGLVRDFVNTVEWHVDVDSWRTPADLAGWLTQRTAVVVDDLSAHDLELARQLREGLRSVLLGHAGHDALPDSIEVMNRALARIPVRMRFEANGAVALSGSAHRSGIVEALGRVLESIDELRVDGSWNRLKACARDSCRWAYWDESRNRSGRWCSMAGCGNFMKMGRRDGRDPAAVSSSGQPRNPTLIDVAGRAGVSIKTVSNVVTGTVRVAEPTRSRVQAAIAELDYRPNLAARALRTGRSAQALSE